MSSSTCVRCKLPAKRHCHTCGAPYCSSECLREDRDLHVTKRRHLRNTRVDIVWGDKAKFNVYIGKGENGRIMKHESLPIVAKQFDESTTLESAQAELKTQSMIFRAIEAFEDDDSILFVPKVFSLDETPLSLMMEFVQPLTGVAVTGNAMIHPQLSGYFTEGKMEGKRGYYTGQLGLPDLLEQFVRSGYGVPTMEEIVRAMGRGYGLLLFRAGYFVIETEFVLARNPISKAPKVALWNMDFGMVREGFWSSTVAAADITEAIEQIFCDEYAPQPTTAMGLSLWCAFMDEYCAVCEAACGTGDLPNPKMIRDAVSEFSFDFFVDSVLETYGTMRKLPAHHGMHKLKNPFKQSPEGILLYSWFKTRLPSVGFKGTGIGLANVVFAWITHKITKLFAREETRLSDLVIPIDVELCKAKNYIAIDNDANFTMRMWLIQCIVVGDFVKLKH